MEDSIKRWKETNTWQKLERSGGKIFVEGRGGGEKAKAQSSSSSSSAYGTKKNIDFGEYPRKAGKAADAVAGSKASSFAASAPVTSETEAFDNFIAGFEAAVKRDGNALMFAVCQGKVSEGIDFTDDKGRAVIVTGIPYAPVVDPRVVLKRQYLDERMRGFTSSSSSDLGTIRGAHTTAKSVYGGGGLPGNALLNKPISAASSGPHVGWGVGIKAAALDSAAPVPPAAAVPAPLSSASTEGRRCTVKANPFGVSGEMWYQQSASRAVNQALGRIIRHRRDWGAIFLLDDRFQKPVQAKQLSSWIRPRLKKYSEYNECMQSFRSFLTRNAPADSAAESSTTSEDAQLFAAKAPTDWDRKKRLQAAAESALGSKKVTVSISTLPSRERDYGGDDDDDGMGISFINPKLFLSQSQPAAAAAASAAARSKPVVSSAQLQQRGLEQPASKPMSMSEVLRMKKNRKSESLVLDHGETQFTTLSSASASASSSAGASSSSSSSSSAHEMYLKAMGGIASSVATSDVSSSSSSSSTSSSSGGGGGGGGLNVFKFSGASQSASLPWSKVDVEGTSASAGSRTAASKAPQQQHQAGAAAAATKGMQQSILSFAKKRDNTAGTGSGSTPAAPESKRAKLGGSSQFSPDVNDAFDLENFTYNPPPKKPAAAAAASTTVANLTCGVCRQKNPDNACAAKGCGHICCKTCWVSWLKLKECCPLCKAPVTEDSIRGLDFK
jgi:hypothetical protein